MTAGVGVSIALMRRYIGTTFVALLDVSWRPLFAAALMGGAVYWLEQNQFDLGRVLPPFARLAGGVVAGVTLYVPIVFLLWFACGRADGPEAYLAARTRAALWRRAA